MLKNSISFLIYNILWLMLLPNPIQCNRDQQPKIYVKSNGLLIEAAYDRNISMRLSRDSSLYLNNVDVMEKIRQRYTSNPVDGDITSKPTPDQLKDEIRLLHDDLERFANRLISSQNRTRRTLQLGIIRRNIGRLNRLTNRLIALEGLLKKDECTEGPCKNGGTCYDSYNDFHCECTEGYTGKTCEEDVDECYMLAGTDLGCQNNAICTNTPGSYKCACAKGFTGTHCRLRNAICHQEQSKELCAHGICVPANNQQSYTCICEQGWKQNTTRTNTTLASLACEVDVNECDSSMNPCHSECINLPGRFKCGPCPGGYTGNGLTCLDINECSINNGGCSLLPKVRCINTEGSYRCGNCPPGWLGDGHTCELAPSNSCDAEKVCHPQAKCEYISDIATCTCPPGMFGHGFGPQGCHTIPIMDSCENHLCQNNGTCLSKGRSTSCLCPIGYSGALCETADGCHPNPCENDGTCKPLADQTFKCSCPPGTTGKRCEILRSVCAKTMRRPTGELKYPTDGSPEYSINERCAWIIRTIPGQILNVTFTKFDVEDNPECSHDWLQIHDGNSLASQLIGRFCGNNLPLGGTILSSHNLLFFWFRSDNNTNRPGFEMTWVSQPHICGETLELGMQASGVIRSPGYPGKTPTNRECQWELSAPYGYRFVIRIYEIVLGTRPSCTGDTLKIYDADLLLKQYCQTSNPEPLRSSSNKVSIHFHTDAYSSDSSFQLHYEVESGIPHCGGIYTESSGIIVGPTQQATCLYLIQQQPGTQIKWEFLDIKQFEVENCNLNSIEIFDGKTDEDSNLLMICGNKPQEAVVSTFNFMLIRYKNSLKDDEHIVPFKAKYSRVCEVRVFGPDSGIVFTPNYPKPFMNGITCTFHIYGPANTIIRANFTDFSIGGSQILDPNEIMDSFNNRTAVSNLNDESLNYVDVYLSKTNKRRYFKASPMELRSERNEMIIVFHAATNSANARGLSVEYSFENLVCGGVYTESSGSFFRYVAVKYKQCIWILEAPEGKHIKLHLEYEPYLEDSVLTIFANTTGGRDLTLWNTTTKQSLDLEFKFNVISIIIHTYIYRLSVQYEFTETTDVCGGNFNTLSGVVSSPSWPASYKPNLDCVWIISAPLGQKIELTVQNFTLEPICSGDVLEIRNGKFATSPLIGRYCGSQIPSRIPSFTNNLYLRFKTDNNIEGSGFHLTWEQTTTGCGGKLTSYEGTIHSPHFDSSNEHNNINNINMTLTCDWQIIVAQGSSVDLTITPSIDLLEFCRKNNLQIYDGTSTLNPLLNLNCTDVLKEQQLHLKSSSNQVLIIYTLTEKSKYFSPEFIIDYETNCKRIISNNRGIIESPNFPEYYPENQNCAWDIKAGRNNKLQLAFSHLSLEAENMECEYDYVEVLDMKDEDVLKKTRLCTQLPDPITSEGNHLRILFVSDYSNNKNGFRAEYIRQGCGEHLEKDFGTINSPNYPYSYDMDCDWYIEVSAGKQIVLTIIEFHLESDNPDCSRDMLLIKETQNSTLDISKECQMQQIPLTITSPSNRLYLHFHTSSIRARKYLKSFYHTKQASCGGRFRGTSGLITSPNYPYTPTVDSYHCIWDITVPESYGIVLDFKDFQMSDSKNCSDAFLKLSKLIGMSETYLEKYCGSEKPSPKLIHSNSLRVEYTESGAQSMGRFSLEYRKQCGGLISKPSGFIKSLANEECIWEFDVAEGTLISINILKLECYCQKTKEGVKICGNGLGFKENQFDAENINSANYTMYLCDEHQSNLVFEVSKLHIFGKNINFEAKYSTTQHSCGGNLISPSGSLASPYFPSTYPGNIECTWTIQAPKGIFIQLQFDQMDIAKSDHCNEDYLEVRERSESKLIGVYCGKDIPDEDIVSFEVLWLRFHSSEGSTGNGFKITWNYAHLNEIVNKTKGYVESPSSKMVENDDEPFAWRIMVERGQFVLLEFEQYNTGLNLYDGFDDTAISVEIPPSAWRFVSSSNVIFFNTDNGNFDVFRIRWNITNNKALGANSTVTACHSEEFINVHRFSEIKVISPGYPEGYNNNLHCDWIFKPTNPTEHVVLSLFKVDLETSSDCSIDYLKISTSSDLEQWHKQEQICNGSSLVVGKYDPPFPKFDFVRPFKSIHGTPHIKLEFVTDASINRTGFYANVMAKCGSNMTDSVGFINSNMLDEFYEDSDMNCVWHINVKPGKRIRLQLDYPRTIPNKNVIECKSYALIYDGIDDHAPLIAPGKICSRQNTSTLIMNSTTNHLTIKYVINPSIEPKIPSWNYTYREYSECSQEIRLIPEAASVNVTSPHYPNVPNPHTDCEWRIVAPQGELIQVEFLERYDMNTRFCTKEFLELFDGSTVLARSLGRYCRKPPNVIKTTQNILFMHYLSDIAEPRNGFKARISISQCGSSFSENYGVIRSPGYPGSYPSSTQCDFAINLSRGQIRLAITDLHLPFDAKKLSTSDYLEIITLGNDDSTEPPILIYGNVTKDTQYQIASSKALIRFHTFMKTTQYRGFMLSYSADNNHCAHNINGVSGHFTMTFSRRLHFITTCTWKISVPKKRRVRLEFLNMDDLRDNNSSSLLNFTVYNNFYGSSKILTFTPNTFQPNATIQSTDNIMFITVVVPRGDTRLKALRAYYSSSDNSPCPNSIDEETETGVIDIRDPDPVFNATNYYCDVKINLNGEETLAFNITSVFTIDTRSRSYFRLTSPVIIKDSYNAMQVDKNLTNSIRGQSMQTGSISIVQNEQLRIQRLQIMYRKYACGGVVAATDGAFIKQPEQVNGPNGGQILCVWTLTKPFSAFGTRSSSDFKLFGNFTFSESCENESIRIFKNQWDFNEPAKRICMDNKNDVKEFVLDARRTLVVYYSSNYNSQKTQFTMNIRKTLSCGSETLVEPRSGVVQIDKALYKNNQECMWIFYAKPGLYLQIEFLGRFFIENSPNCSKDYLEIQRYDQGLWIPEARFCGRETPAAYNVSSSRIQVVFRTDGNVTVDGFSFIIQAHCLITVNVTSTQPQIIVSPSSRLGNLRSMAMSYRRNAMLCEYTFLGNKTDKLINVKVRSESNLRRYSQDICVFGTFKVFKHDEAGMDKEGIRHCEMEFEERAYKYLRLGYDSRIPHEYTIEYSYDSCGGNVTAPTTIRPLKHEQNGQYADNMNCVWYITAPADHSIVIRFKYFETEENYDHVSIYRGHLIAADKRLIQLSGNQTTNIPTIVVDQNLAVINAVSDVSNSHKGFEANIVFIANCNERISLTDGNSPVTLSRNFKFNSTEEYICNYRISAPNGYRIKVDIKKLQLNSVNSTCQNLERQCAENCNYLEIIDSSSAQQSSMGRFCSTASMNKSVITSYEYAVLKLKADYPGQYNFEIILNMAKTECGEITDYKMGDKERYKFTFPQNGGLIYAPNTHCTWRLSSEQALRLHFNYIDLQNSSQVTGKCVDYVLIKGPYNSPYYFCGQAKNYTFNLNDAFYNYIDITFHSDDLVEGKGFELIAERNGACNRTYNLLSGNIVYDGYSRESDGCNDVVVVPENYTLSFYITSLYFKNYNCDKLHFKITDLKTNKTLLNRCQNAYTTVNLFTTTNAVRIESADYNSIALTYIASERSSTPGCGGSLYSAKGYFASPSYENDRNFSECRWDVVVPSTNIIELQFFDFNMGTATNCHLDNVKIIEILPNNSEKLLKTLCGSDRPEDILSSSNHVLVISKKTPNFDGVGWVANYNIKQNYEEDTNGIIVT